MQVRQGPGRERISGADRIHDRDPRSLDARRPERRAGRGPMLAARHEDKRNAGRMPSRYDILCGAPRIQPDQILFAHLQDVDQPQPALETIQVRHPVRDQPRPHIGIQTDHSAPGLPPQQPFKRGSHRLEHESDRTKVQSGFVRQRRQMLRQQSAIGRALGMEEYVGWPPCRWTAASVVRSSVSTK